VASAITLVIAAAPLVTMTVTEMKVAVVMDNVQLVNTAIITAIALVGNALMGYVSKNI
jgi:hypothetical protein